VTCKASSFTVNVVNPPRPRAAVESLIAQTFGKCTATISNARSVKVRQAQQAAVPDHDQRLGGLPGHGDRPEHDDRAEHHARQSLLHLQGGDRQGHASNAKQVITFTEQHFKLSSGPRACPPKGTSSVSYGPVIDRSVSGGPHVFVN
jgi:hypothetical protein